jgi:hypothetical protein
MTPSSTVFPPTTGLARFARLPRIPRFAPLVLLLLLLATACTTAPCRTGPALDDALAALEQPAGLPPDLAAACAAIRPSKVYNTCKWLSLPQYRGRYPGTPEFRDVCDWVAARFAEWGLRPAGPDGSYLQPYPSPYTIVKDASLRLLLPGVEVDLEPETDFLPLFYCDSGIVQAPLVFVGWGISAPELGYDDYSGIDVKGKFVLCFRGSPDREVEGFTEHDHHRNRMLTARDKGAVGLLYIYDNVNANPNGDRIENFLPLTITETIGDRILEQKKIKAAELKAELRETKEPRSFPLAASVDVSVTAEHFPDAEAYNVIGWIEGADPVLKNEFLLAGGHLDHCGEHMGLLFTGANDNASGSAVVMQAAEAFGRLATPPKRSVIFALFGSEERGLIGSKHLSANLPPMVGKLTAMFNCDMEGEGDGTGVVHSPDRPELRAAIEKADTAVGTVRRYSEFRRVGVRGSDFAPFYRDGVPCVAFWSNGPHLHYHQTGDTIYRINPDMLADVSRLLFLSVYYLAHRDGDLARQDGPADREVE